MAMISLKAPNSTDLARNETDGNPAGIKHAMKFAGLDSGEMRLPLWEASDATKTLIEQLVTKIGAKPR